MRGFERRKEQKKESIRRAAQELFELYGFQKVTLSDIAHRARVSPVTIYNHFGSKQGLVRDVVRGLILNWLEKYHAVVKGEGSFQDKLEFIIFDKVGIMSQYQGELVQTIIREDPEIQEFVESIWQREVNKLVIDFFEEGKKEGYVNPGLSREAVLSFFEILRRGTFATSELLKNAEDSAKLMGELLSIYVYGLVGKKG